MVDEKYKLSADGKYGGRMTLAAAFVGAVALLAVTYFPRQPGAGPVVNPTETQAPTPTPTQPGDPSYQNPTSGSSVSTRSTLPSLSQPTPTSMSSQSTNSVLPTYDDGTRQIVLENCRRDASSTECTLRVTVTRSDKWWFSPKVGLVDPDGKLIVADSVSIGGESRSLADLRSIGDGKVIDPGNSTKVTLRFNKAINPIGIQSLRITWRWDKPFAGLKPVPWQ